MIRTLTGVAFFLALFFLFIGAGLLLNKQWIDGLIACGSACPWLLAGIAGVLIDTKREQRQRAARQHAELMAALKKVHDELAVIEVANDSRLGRGG